MYFKKKLRIKTLIKIKKDYVCHWERARNTVDCVKYV